jgi:hypothetical protein
MKKLLLPVMFLSALALSGATLPAVATESVETVSAVESVIVADSGAVLSAPTVEITTEPAPEPVAAPVEAEPVYVAPVEPVATVEPVQPAPTTPEPVAVPVEPVATPEPVAATVEPAIECTEDQPCWDCNTMGNRLCGLNEAIALSGYDSGTFFNYYVGIYPVGTVVNTDDYKEVTSVINPSLKYVFTAR